MDANTECQPRSQPIEMYGSLNMGKTAKNLAGKYHTSRKKQDECANRSQTLTQKAIERGYFEKVTGLASIFSNWARNSCKGDRLGSFSLISGL